MMNMAERQPVLDQPPPAMPDHEDAVSRSQSIISRIRRKLSRKAVELAERELERIRAFDRGRSAILDPAAVLYPSSRIENLAGDRSRIRIGGNSHIRGRLLIFANGGEIRIGEFCYIGEASNVWSMSSIEIGHRVLIAHNVNLHDNISHSRSASERHAHFQAIIEKGHPSSLSGVASEPIVIEDDAWIGFNSTILKGVRIGRGAIVGAGSVVTKTIGPFDIVVGNPAIKIGEATS